MAPRTSRVFGSFARGEATIYSDLDLLVDMAANRSLLDTVGLVQTSRSRWGRRVDVVTGSGAPQTAADRILERGTTSLKDPNVVSGSHR